MAIDIIQLQNEYVYKTYELIAKEFDDTRFCIWNSVKLFLDSLPNYSLIADIGCGNGKYMKYQASNKQYQYIGIDTCQNLLEIGRKRNYNLILGNAISLPYRNNAFEYAISIAVLHHIYSKEDRIRFISEILRIVKPGGRIHITVWADSVVKKNFKYLGNGDYLFSWKNIHNSRYYHLFNKNELEDLLNNFKNVATYEIGYEMENWYITLQKFV